VPYASIIIPTFDRHSTLPFVVRSLQNQTVRDIEIIISGDGCTPAVRIIAQGLAGEDARITFLDFPKAPMRGAFNRDKAVRVAKSERIFYSDDDDVMLPHHVQTLGAELETADVVDTPVASLRLYGPPALGILDSGHPVQRDMLQTEKLKGVFDTHLAHTKKVYLDRSGAWTNPPDRRVVLHMLKAFASDATVRWKTLQRTTALSLHGARRFNASPTTRAAELTAISAQLSPQMEWQLRSDGGYCAYGLALLKAVSGQPIADANGLMAIVGVPASIVSDRQRQPLSALVDAWYGRKPDPQQAAHAIHQLLEPLHAPFFRIAETVSIFIKTLGLAAVGDMLERLPDDLPVQLGRAHLRSREGNLTGALRATEAALAIAGETDSLAVQFARAEDLAAFEQPDMAWSCMNDLLPSVPHSFQMTRFWRLRAKLANARGATKDHAEALSTLESLSALET